MRSLICILILALTTTVSIASKHDALIRKHFTSANLKAANTASHALYMNQTERDVIQFMNLARLYPVKFAAFYKEYLEKHHARGLKAFKQKDKYYYTLYTDLLANKDKKLEPYTPNKQMFQLAKCWAIESGKKGVIGHNRKNCEKGYSAECCSYMWSSDAMDHVLLLLMDNDTPGVGHRVAMLGSYKSVGVSMQDHEGYGKCTVLDFSRSSEDVASR